MKIPGTFTMTLWIMAVSAVLGLAALVGLAYVAIHFIAKVW